MGAAAPSSASPTSITAAAGVLACCASTPDDAAAAASFVRLERGVFFLPVRGVCVGGLAPINPSRCSLRWLGGFGLRAELRPLPGGDGSVTTAASAADAFFSAGSASSAAFVGLAFGSSFARAAATSGSSDTTRGEMVRGRSRPADAARCTLGRKYAADMESEISRCGCFFLLLIATAKEAACIRYRARA